MTDMPGGAGRKKVVFLGTPDVAASSLELLLRASRQGRGGGFDIVRAVSNPPARVGRKKVLKPCPVQTLAESEGVPVMIPTSAKDDGFLADLEELEPDLCITAAYGQFLPQRFLDIPKFGTLNVHPSLLPRYRGASPVQRCLEAGEPETGVTVAFTVLKMDAGPIVRQKVTDPQAGRVCCPDHFTAWADNSVQIRSKSMDQPGKVANPARSQLHRENGYSPVPVRALEFGLARRVQPSRPASACSFYILRLNQVLTYGIPPDFRGDVHLFI